MERSYLGVFTLYEDGERAVDELALSGVSEDALNVIAAAETFQSAGPADRLANTGGTATDHMKDAQVLDELLLRGEAVYLPDTGRIIAVGQRARALVEETFRMFGDTASLSKTLGRLGIMSEDASEVTRLVRKGGVLVLVDQSQATRCDPRQVYLNNGANMVISITTETGGTAA